MHFRLRDNIPERFVTSIVLYHFSRGQPYVPVGGPVEHPDNAAGEGELVY